MILLANFAMRAWRPHHDRNWSTAVWMCLMAQVRDGGAAVSGQDLKTWAGDHAYKAMLDKH